MFQYSCVPNESSCILPEDMQNIYTRKSECSAMFTQGNFVTKQNRKDVQLSLNCYLRPLMVSHVAKVEKEKMDQTRILSANASLDTNKVHYTLCTELRYRSYWNQIELRGMISEKHFFLMLIQVSGKKDMHICVYFSWFNPDSKPQIQTKL